MATTGHEVHLVNPSPFLRPGDTFAHKQGNGEFDIGGSLPGALIFKQAFEYTGEPRDSFLKSAEMITDIKGNYLGFGNKALDQTAELYGNLASV